MIAPLVVSVLLIGPGHPAEGIAWRHDFEQALAEAAKTGKPLMVDFWANWCDWCHRLDATTYKDPAVVELSRRFVAVKVNTEGGPDEVAVASRYDVSSLPTIAFLSPNGRQLMKVDGFQGPGQFPRTMSGALKVASSVGAWEKSIDCDSKDAGALVQLGIHAFDQQFYEDSRELLFRARKVDGGEAMADRKQVRLLLGVIQYYDGRYGEAEELLEEGLALGFDVEHDPRILFVMGRNYQKWRKPDKARQVLEKLLEKHGSSSVAPRARETLRELEHLERKPHKRD